jgi:hypothetical protein
MNRFGVWRQIAASAFIVTLLLLIASGQPQRALASSADLAISPSSQTVSVGTIFTITITQNADVATTAIQTDFSFNPSLLQVLALGRATVYSAAGHAAGVSPQTELNAIAESNQTGRLKNYAAFLAAGDNAIPSGQNDALTLTIKACGSGTATLSLSNYKMTDDNWDLILAIGSHIGSVTISGSAASGGTSDSDADAIRDGCDDCPAWSNTSQALPNWSPVGTDSDCDGFPDSTTSGGKAPESFLGTNASLQCAQTSTANDEAGSDNWPADFNDDQLSDAQDSNAFTPVYGSAAPGPPYQARFDLTGNGIINGQDIGKLGTYQNKTCSLSGT